MYLYSNIKYLTEIKISQNKLANLSSIPQKTINENIKYGREFKGTQIDKLFQVFKHLGFVESLDDLFHKDLSKEQE